MSSPRRADEPQRLLEAERAGRDERGVLAEAVPGRKRGGTPVTRELAKHLEAGDFMRQQRRLREARELELVARIRNDSSARS